MKIFKARFEIYHKEIYHKGATGTIKGMPVTPKNGTIMKGTCTLLALFSCLLLSPAVRAQGSYTLTNDDVKVVNGVITEYSSFETRIIIPNILDGLVITGIRAWVFGNRDMRSVVLPPGLTSIGASAFYGNVLRSVDFSACTGLTKIGQYAFSFNVFLTSLDLSKCTRLTDIGERAFSRNHLVSVDLSACTGLTIINTATFYRNKLTSLVLPPGITEIGKKAFDTNQLTSVDLPPGLTRIREAAFDDNPRLGNVILPSGTLDGFTNSWKGGEREDSGGREEAGAIYGPGSRIPHFNRGYVRISNPYMLTDDDVTVSEGVLRGYEYSGAGQSPTEIIIPPTLKRQSITGIGHNAFKDNQLTGVALPPGLTGIGNSSFQGNLLTGLALPSGLTKIWPNAFRDNILVSVDMSACKSLTSIGSDAFHSNNLTGVVLPPGLTVIEESVFQHNLLTGVALPPGLTSIGSYAFMSNEMFWLALPPGLFKIGKGAFKANGLNRVTLPPGLIAIGEDAFLDNNLKAFTLPSEPLPGFTNTWASRNGERAILTDVFHRLDYSYVRLSSLPYELQSSDVTVGDGGMLENYTYSGSGSPPTVIVIPDVLDGKTITGIRGRVFYDHQLSSVDMSGCTGLTSIGSDAFYKNNLTSLVLPPGLTSIGSRAFYSNQLTSVDLPKGLTSIGSSAFSNNRLSSVDLSGCTRLTSIGSHAFFANLLTSVDFSGCTGLTSIGAVAFQFNFLKSLDLSECAKLTRITGRSAFADNKLTSVDMPPSLTSIGHSAFEDNKLTSVDLPSSLINIGPYAFKDNLLSSLDLPPSLITIGEVAFYRNRLPSVYLPPLITSIGESAFSGNRMQSFALPASAHVPGYPTDWIDVRRTRHARGSVVNYLGSFYQLKINLYDIKYNLDGGDQHADNPASYTVRDLPIVLKAPTRGGYNFDGWYGEDTFTTTALTGIGKGSVGLWVFYAKWTGNQAPTDITLNKMNINENDPVGTLIGTLSTADPNPSDTHTYTLSGPSADFFQIDGDQLKSNVQLDYERCEASYQVTVTATERETTDRLSIDKTFTIMLLDVNEAPTGITLDKMFISENLVIGTPIGTFSTADPDAGDTHVYELSGPGAGSFEIVDGQLQSKVQFDYEVGETSYQVIVTATEGGTEGLSIEETLTITVLDANDTPTGIALDGEHAIAENLPGAPIGTFSVTDQDKGDVHTYRLLTKDDGGSFVLVTTPEGKTRLRTAGSFNFDDKPIYTFTVRATDREGATYSEQFTIRSMDVNDAPTGIALNGMTIDENSDPGTLIGTLSTADPDAGDTHTYTLSGSDADLFQIDGDQLQSNVQFDYEGGETSYQVTVTATDRETTDGLSIEETFTITVLDANEPPTNITLSEDTIAENLAPGTPIGTFSTADPDAGDTHTYTLSGPDSDIFRINGDQLQSNVQFDFESESSYRATVVYFITIRVTDRETGGLSIEKAFTIGLLDANDAPVLKVTLDDATTQENAVYTLAIPATNATDEDGDELTVTVGALPEGLAYQDEQITGTPTQSAVGVHEITVTYSDGLESVTDTFALTVQDVQDVNNAPVLVKELPDSTIKAGEFWALPIDPANATDEDGDVLAIKVIGMPEGMIYQDGRISGISKRVCSYRIAVTYSDPSGASVTDMFVLTVVNVLDEAHVLPPLVHSLESTIKVYPNPASTRLTIELNGPSKGIYDLTVMDLTGNTVLEIWDLDGLMNENRLTFPVSRLSSGLYFIKFMSKGTFRSTVRKILVKRG